MDDDTRHHYEAKSAKLRVELKQFEADFASRNGGNKPSRQDIKQNPNIAAKYKKYNHVRDILAGKAPATPSRPQRNKREAENLESTTPSKRTKHLQTPSKTRSAVFDDGILDTPSLQILFSPAMPTSIGPTPQRNGRILGIFDLLEENNENEPPTDGIAKKGSKAQVTPSKRPASEMEDFKLGRTPVSSSKRNLLNSFMTPSKRKTDNPLGATTPSSVSKLHLATPAFLRRAPLPTVDEDGHYFSPPKPLRLPPKPLGRSLSSVVADLRKMEEERLDAELDALHEMENETIPSNNGKPSVPSKTQPKILEPDSQIPQLLGGFDDEGLYDSPTEEAKGRDGQPLRIYKKKGQKRTTRRVNIKPTIAKRPEPQDDAKGETGEGDTDDDVVPETQHDANQAAEGLSDVDPDFDFEEPDDEEDEEPTKKKKKAPKAAEKKTSKAAETKTKEGKVRKVARKVNELAHANFKRLKLRNSGSKGGPGFGSRFRRRR